MSATLSRGAKRVNRNFAPVAIFYEAKKMTLRMARRRTLSERATSAVAYLARETRGFASRVAKRAKVPQSSMTRVVKGDQPVTLAILEAVEDETGRSALHLLADPDDEQQIVTGDERRLLRYCRMPLMPREVRDALLVFLEYYANEPPGDRDLRNALSLLRRLDDGKRRRVLAFLMVLTEGLPPDLEVALRLPDEATEPAPTGPRRARRVKRHA